MKIEPSYTETVKTDSQESSTKFDKGEVHSDRVGVVRRAGKWSGGFYTELGGEENRGFTKEASDGSSISGEEPVYIAPSVGVFGEFAAGPGTWDFDFKFIQARNFGPTDSQGDYILTDHFSIRFGGYFDLGGMGLDSSVTHQTLSYADSAFVNMDSIPFSSVRSRLLVGDQENNFFIGGILGYGKDGQSLPEFNASYEMAAAALTMGLFFSL
jgi:hypothetical protein